MHCNSVYENHNETKIPINLLYLRIIITCIFYVMDLYIVVFYLDRGSQVST